MIKILLKGYDFHQFWSHFYLKFCTWHHSNDEEYKNKKFFSFKMYTNCSQSEISIIGDRNVVYFEGSAHPYNPNCRSFHSNFLTDVILIIVICFIFIFCIGCCYCLCKKRRSQVIIVTDQFCNQDNINKC